MLQLPATPAAEAPAAASETLLLPRSVTPAAEDPAAASETPPLLPPSITPPFSPTAANAARVLVFDPVQSKAFIINTDWEGLEKYLCNCIAPDKKPEEVAIIHPDLLLIPREKKIVEMLQDRKFEAAKSYFDKSIASLKKSEESLFRPFDLDLSISDIEKFLNKRPISASHMTNEEIEMRISDYFELYISDITLRLEENDKYQNALWQFGKKFTNPTPVEGEKEPKNDFRCLARQWIPPPLSKGIGVMKEHLIHGKSTKCCPKVTQELLNRLKGINRAKEVQNLSEIAKHNKVLKRKPLSNISPVAKYKSSSMKGKSAKSDPASKKATEDTDLEVTASKKATEVHALEVTASKKATDGHALEVTASKKPRVDPVLEKIDDVNSLCSQIMTQVKASMESPEREVTLGLLMDQAQVLCQLKNQYVTSSTSPAARASKETTWPTAPASHETDMTVGG